MTDPIMDLDNFKHNLSNLKKCDQVWDEMNLVLGGRLCAKFDKKIKDFSVMTHSKIDFFMADRNEPVCGFYVPEPLPQFAKKKSILLATLGLSTLLTTSLIYGQPNTITKLETYQTTKYKTIDLTNLPNSENIKKIDTIFIKGNIQSIDTYSKKNEPVGFASIIIKETKISVTANESGEFVLCFHPIKDSGTLSLLLAAKTYKTKQVDIVYNDKTQIDLGTITMLKDIVTFECYVFTKKRTKFEKFWQKITKPFRRK